MAELIISRGHPCPPLQTSNSLMVCSSRFPSSGVPISSRRSFSGNPVRSLSGSFDRVSALHSLSSSTCFCGSRCYRLQIFEVGSRNSRVCARFQLTRGYGESRNSTLGVRAGSSSNSSSRDVWEGGISLNSRAEPVTEEEEGGKWTQSVLVEPTAQPQFVLTSVQQDVGMACVVLLGAFFWVRLFDFFTSKRILGQKLSRKMVHITSGLLYMLSWPFFSTSKWAPFLAGLVPLANGIRLLIYGFGLLKDEGLVKSMSRSGESRELLRGPLFYVMVLYFSTVFFWRQSPVGMIALSMMCGGDGIADIMGRRFGSKKLPYNSSKSFAGSTAMFLFGFLVSSMCVYYFTLFGFFTLDLYSTAVRLALISFVATIVESLPITTKLDDNFTVPVTSFLLGVVLFPPLKVV